MQLNKRNGAIDFWKFVFSVIIVMFHTFHYKSIHGIQPFIGGNSAVEFFFLVSGFLMAQSASKLTSQEINIGKETFRFMIRKIKGLFPEFAVAWFIGFAVIHLSKDTLSFTMVVKNLLTGIWELVLLRMSGLAGFRVNVVTWYISAMLLAMLILYPLLIKYKESFFYIIAPCLAIFLLGYMYQNFGNLGGGTAWEGFYYRGVMRAFAELSLGCVLWKICQQIKRYNYTREGGALLSAIEIAGYGFCVYWMFSHGSSEMSFVLLMIFAVCVTITFSHVGAFAHLFDNQVCYVLGKASFSLYISHIYWIKTIDIFWGNISFEKQLLILFGCIVLNVIGVMYISEYMRKKTPAFMRTFQNFMIVKE